MLYHTDKEFNLSFSQLKDLYPDTSFPIDAQISFGELKSYTTAPPPSFDSSTHSVREIFPVNGVQQWEVFQLSEEEITHRAEAAVASKTQQIAGKVETLWSAADSYINNFISGVAVGLLTIGVIQQKPKALAIMDWTSKIWAEYYIRKALITEDSIENLDFSSFGPIPFSVPELQAEVEL